MKNYWVSAHLHDPLVLVLISSLCIAVYCTYYSSWLKQRLSYHDHRPFIDKTLRRDPLKLIMSSWIILPGNVWNFSWDGQMKWLIHSLTHSLARILLPLYFGNDRKSDGDLHGLYSVAVRVYDMKSVCGIHLVVYVYKIYC